jgi:hypothetical protein
VRLNSSGLTEALGEATGLPMERIQQVQRMCQGWTPGREALSKSKSKARNELLCLGFPKATPTPPLCV